MDNALSTGVTNPSNNTAADDYTWGVCAILTNRRLLLCQFDGDGSAAQDYACALTIRCERVVRDGDGENQIGSILWVGPSLLFTHRDGISCLGWDGDVCALASAGVGGGDGALLTVTEDAALALHVTGGGGGVAAAAPAVVSRPIALFDAIAFGWGTLCAARRDAGLPPPVDAREAVARAAGRHDASRASAKTLERIASARRGAGLPGLAADVAARATHVPRALARGVRVASVSRDRRRGDIAAPIERRRGRRGVAREGARGGRRPGAFYLTLVPIRPRLRGERRSLRTFPGVSLRSSLAFNPRPRCLSTSTDAFEIHPRTSPRRRARRRKPPRRLATPRARSPPPRWPSARPAGRTTGR